MDKFIHPELQKGEVFFTNSNYKGFEKMKWTSKRKGSKAYDGEGRLLHDTNWFPVFIQTNELEKHKLDLKTMRRQWIVKHESP